MNYYDRFDKAVSQTVTQLQLYGQQVQVESWQGVPTEGKPDLVTREILDVHFTVPMMRASWWDTSDKDYITEIAEELHPNLPWADAQFAERIGGVPRNPDPSLELWPWWQGQSDTTMVDGKFTHTYSERFWPPLITGIHYRYGNYRNVVGLLARQPHTRQAYLPIFFPEDTGAVHGGRTPCTLGYHLLLRDGRLNCWYEIRSCDAVRHFRDDLYLAVRLVAHTIEQLRGEEAWIDVLPGNLYFTAHSFHVHAGDYHLL